MNKSVLITGASRGLGEGSERIYSKIREHVPPMETDRLLKKDIKSMLELVRGSTLAGEVRAVSLTDGECPCSVSDLITELDILGIITTKIISKGRYGRTREIQLTLNPKQLLKLNQILSEELFIE